MAGEFIPRNYQNVMAEHVINNPRCALWVPPGLGKTSATLMALEYLNLVEEVYPVLIIAPLRVARDVWLDEIYKWNDFKHLRITTIIGTQKQRLEALKVKAQIYTINYENIPWLIETFKGKWPFKVIVADEASRLRSFRLRQGGKQAAALAKVAFQSSRFIELTGTPSPAGLISLYGQIWFLDQGQRLGKTFYAFENRWFRRGRDGYSLKPLAHAEEEILSLIKDLCLSINPLDYFDLKEPIRNYIYVNLPDKAHKIYREMENKWFVELQEKGIEAFSVTSMMGKVAQIASGILYTDDKRNYSVIHDEKLEALHSIIEESNGAPVLVAYHFKADLERLQKAFPKGRVLGKDNIAMRQWNKGQIPILFVHPASAGHGLNLQDGGNILVFYGLDWNLENHLQVIERIGPMRQLQSGHNRPVYIHYILTKGSIDELILKRLDSKKTVQDILLEAVRVREKH